MSAIVAPPVVSQRLPDHTQLPETDGSIVENFQEHPQGELLTDCIEPVLKQLHPDSQYAIGMDSGIYWRFTDPPLKGCKSPDWFYVPGVPPMLEGIVRRSYVMWYEGQAPMVIIEFVSGDGTEERDQTPLTGKFWVYERGIRAPYYAIYEVNPGRVDLYQLMVGKYALVPANERGHFPIPPLGVELGIWQGVYRNYELPWLRWWDADGNLLPTSAEQNRELKQQADAQIQMLKQQAGDDHLRAQAAEQKAARLAEQLRSLGANPEEV